MRIYPQREDDFGISENCKTAKMAMLCMWGGDNDFHERLGIILHGFAWLNCQVHSEIDMTGGGGRGGEDGGRCSEVWRSFYFL